MVDPGWYHADGDPGGSVRYWDGTTWVGEAKTSDPSAEIIYYAPAEDAQVDLGDVAVRKTLAEQATTGATSTSYATSPYAVSKGKKSVQRRRLPEGLKNLTILVCAFKSVPLLLLAFSVARLAANSALSGDSVDRYAPPGLDFDADAAVGLLIMAVMVALAVGLLVSQGKAALKDQASLLFSVAFILVIIDALNLANQWARFGGAGVPLAITGITALQALVAAWAYKHSRSG